MDSLGRKFALVVFVAIVLAGFAIGYVVLMLQQNIALQQQQAIVQQGAKLLAQQLNADLLQKLREMRSKWVMMKKSSKL